MLGIYITDFFNETKKWIVSILVLVAALYLLSNWGSLSWIDNADLIFHEAGHFFFMLFGKFIYTLGGTLMQIMIPLMIFSYFFIHEYRTGVQISLLWLGQNFINISVYAADARAQKLPLLGGKYVYHDWNFILGELGLLQYDTEVGYLWVAFAVVTFSISVLMPLIIRD